MMKLNIYGAKYEKTFKMGGEKALCFTLFYVFYSKKMKIKKCVN